MACGQTSRHWGGLKVETAKSYCHSPGILDQTRKKKNRQEPYNETLRVLRFKPLASRALGDQVSVIWSPQLFFLWHIGVLEAGPVRLGLYWKNKVLCVYRRHTPRSPGDAGMKAKLNSVQNSHAPVSIALSRGEMSVMEVRPIGYGDWFKHPPQILNSVHVPVPNVK